MNKLFQFCNLQFKWGRYYAFQAQDKEKNVSLEHMCMSCRKVITLTYDLEMCESMCCGFFIIPPFFCIFSPFFKVYFAMWEV